MPIFGDAAGGNVTKKMNVEELKSAIRFAIADELEAINGYNQIALSIDNEVIKAGLKDIASEEEVHMGELMAILQHIDKSFKGNVESGMEEATEGMRSARK